MTRITRLFYAGFAGAVGILLGAAPAPKPPPKPAPPPHHDVSAPFKNPHLRGAEKPPKPQDAKPQEHPDKSSHPDVHTDDIDHHERHDDFNRRDHADLHPTLDHHHAFVHHAWYGRWDYHPWIVLHRGLGTLRGFVHKGNGEPADGVRVALQKPGGALFAHISMKHITYTDSEGNFVMFGVRAGGYRVFAYAMANKKIQGHNHADVHPGVTSSVNVKL